MSQSNIMGQLSLFDTPLVTGSVSATCLWECDQKPKSAELPSPQMKRLIPAGEYVVQVGEHPLVLCPTSLTPSDVPEGHRFYHYLVGGRVYSGIFVGVREVV